MVVQNTGICPLTFRLRVIDALRGNIPRTSAPEKSPEKPGKRKTRGKINDEKRRSTPRMPELRNVLGRDEEQAIFGGGLERSVDRCFSFSNLDENMQLPVPEKKKMEFGIHFHRPSMDDDSTKEKDAGTATKGKKKRREPSKRDDSEKLNYCYVLVLELTLGSSVFVQDFVIICSLK
ncbi:uncharacterized protein LOC122396596 [Colletes gigas]|uniref:uncharacterized protein LOC122396596 n=1 Tax=Colletes gigas TaxID=935657 RepID=UPI001C9AE96A|nr:uncharacterized protein LOC122396596 [Colletes gigas]